MTEEREITIHDVMKFLCDKADEENRAAAKGHRDHSLHWAKSRATELPKIIASLRELRLDLDD